MYSTKYVKATSVNKAASIIADAEDGKFDSILEEVCELVDDDGVDEVDGRPEDLLKVRKDAREDVRDADKDYEVVARRERYHRQQEQNRTRRHRLLVIFEVEALSVRCLHLVDFVVRCECVELAERAARRRCNLGTHLHVVCFAGMP